MFKLDSVSILSGIKNDAKRNFKLLLVEANFIPFMRASNIPPERLLDCYHDNSCN